MASALRVVETLGLHGLRPEHRWGRRSALVASELSSGGRLWVALSAVGALSTRTRRAAGEGLAAWTIASGLSFGLKALTHRRRPSWVRTLGRRPRSSSLPSSHTAGAVAYATAVAWRAPVAAPVVLPAAAVVAWSRWASARHFPSDVALGAVLGVVVGVAVHRLAARTEPMQEEHEAPASRLAGEHLRVGAAS
jgi:undecaprenyl-diphosphatase